MTTITNRLAAAQQLLSNKQIEAENAAKLSKQAADRTSTAKEAEIVTTQPVRALPVIKDRSPILDNGTLVGLLQAQETNQTVDEKKNRSVNSARHDNAAIIADEKVEIAAVKQDSIAVNGDNLATLTTTLKSLLAKGAPEETEFEQKRLGFPVSGNVRIKNPVNLWDNSLTSKAKA